ncbi:MAG: DsbA family protein [Candidatus Nomurabacteria bacterium]|jgi:protein-disulfide isomerase|nr:DsbA family protein [Candidatus Nomurabacteria bacterium]
MNTRLWAVFGVVIAAILYIVISYANAWPPFADSGKKSSEISIEGFTFDKIIDEDTIPASYTGDKNLVADTVDGKKDSNVVVIEWLNFQCSACYSLSPSMREIYDQYSDRVAFVDRYLYLSGHPNGLAATVTAEAAGRQGKYHDMYDTLFINQPEWGPATADTREDIFAKYASDLGLDEQQWRDDYKNYEKNGIKARLDFQSKLGLESGVNGTPYIMVNGEKVDNTKTAITEAIENAL